VISGIYDCPPAELIEPKAAFQFRPAILQTANAFCCLQDFRRITARYYKARPKLHSIAAATIEVCESKNIEMVFNYILNKGNYF